MAIITRVAYREPIGASVFIRDYHLEKSRGSEFTAAKLELSAEQQPTKPAEIMNLRVCVSLGAWIKLELGVCNSRLLTNRPRGSSSPARRSLRVLIWY
jgi:hypothetical protein